MGAAHMLKFHVLVPVAIAGALLLLGLPFSTAVLVGMMAGCMSMVFMMAGGSSRDHDADEDIPAADRKQGRGR